MEFQILGKKTVYLAKLCALKLEVGETFLAFQLKKKTKNKNENKYKKISKTTLKKF
jgi:hypothetical protein